MWRAFRGCSTRNVTLPVSEQVAGVEVAATLSSRRTLEEGRDLDERRDAHHAHGVVDHLRDLRNRDGRTALMVPRHRRASMALPNRVGPWSFRKATYWPCLTNGDGFTVRHQFATMLTPSRRFYWEAAWTSSAKHDVNIHERCLTMAA